MIHNNSRNGHAINFTDETIRRRRDSRDDRLAGFVARCFGNRADFARISGELTGMFSFDIVSPTISEVLNISIGIHIEERSQPNICFLIVVNEIGMNVLKIKLSSM